MDILGFLSSAAPAAIAAAGTWFLVNEVDHAHQFEELSREMNDAQEFLTLYRTDLREFWIRSAMIKFNWDRTKTDEAANLLSDADISAAAQAYRQFWEQKVADSLDRWKNKTVHAQLARRKRLLWIGFWLLIASAATQILMAMPKLF